MQQVGRTGVLLDKAAMDHVKLMADPCQGNIVRAAYATPGGGMLVRLKSIVTLAASAGETTGVFHWTPGMNEYYANGAATTTTTFTPAAASLFPVLVTTSGTGNSARMFRCLAACTRLMTNASEMNRAGFVWAGQTTNAYFGAHAGSQANTQSVAAGLPVMARVPANFLEVLWAPSSADTEFESDSNIYALAVDTFNNGKNAMTLVVGGLPAGTGVSIECTAVYEVNFASQLGYVNSSPGPASMTPWNQVLGAFYKFIHNAPVIVDTVRRSTEYIGAAMGSAEGRAIMTGAARLALTAA